MPCLASKGLEVIWQGRRILGKPDSEQIINYRKEMASKVIQNASVRVDTDSLISKNQAFVYLSLHESDGKGSPA